MIHYLQMVCRHGLNFICSDYKSVEIKFSAACLGVEQVIAFKINPEDHYKISRLIDSLFSI